MTGLLDWIALDCAVVPTEVTTECMFFVLSDLFKQ